MIKPKCANCEYCNWVPRRNIKAMVDACVKTGWIVTEYIKSGTIPSWCPLKPKPDTKEGEE